MAKDTYHLSAWGEIVKVCALQGNGIDSLSRNIPRVGILIDLLAANKTEGFQSAASTVNESPSFFLLNLVNSPNPLKKRDQASLKCLSFYKP